MKPDYKWLVVPVVLLAALGLLLFLNQPKTSPAEGEEYVNVNGDEYLAQDYITPDEEGIGEKNPLIKETKGYAKSPQECLDENDSLRDFCLAEYAYFNEDEKGCEMAGEQGIRDDCYAALAQKKLDAGLCEKVKYGYTECTAFIAIETGTASLCEKGDYELEQCIKAVNEEDSALCAEGYDRRYCNDAVLNNDASLCNSIRGYKEFCYYNIAVQKNDASLCSRAGPSRDTCYFAIAKETRNAAICENLSETRDNCVAWVAFLTGNRELCFQAGSEARSCIEDIEGA